MVAVHLAIRPLGFSVALHQYRTRFHFLKHYLPSQQLMPNSLLPSNRPVTSDGSPRAESGLSPVTVKREALRGNVASMETGAPNLDGQACRFAGRRACLVPCAVDKPNILDLLIFHYRPPFRPLRIGFFKPLPTFCQGKPRDEGMHSLLLRKNRAAGLSLRAKRRNLVNLTSHNERLLRRPAPRNDSLPRVSAWLRMRNRP